MPFTVEESIKTAQAKMKVFESLWNEVNNPEEYIAVMAAEKDLTALLRGEVFAKGAAVLRDLTKNHFTREKPGFFARLFRTKAAREYKAERDEMNRITRQLKDLSDNNEMLAYSVVGDRNAKNPAYVSAHEPVSVEYMTKDRESFEFCDRELNENMEATRTVFLRKLNANEPNMQDTKEQIICTFLNEIDTKMAAPVEQTAAQPKAVQEQDPALAEKLDKEFTNKPAEKIEENLEQTNTLDANKEL